MYIKDLLSDNSNFLSHQERNDKYSVGCNFHNILQIRQSILFSWRGAIHGTDVKNIHINRNNITLRVSISISSTRWQSGMILLEDEPNR